MPWKMTPAVGPVTEHSDDDDDVGWDRSSRSGRVEATVTWLPPLQTQVAFEGATACDEFGKLGGDGEFPERKP